MVIKAIGLDKCLRRYGRGKDIDMYPVVLPATQQVQNDAKVLAPVKTGYLQGSIHRRTTNRGKDSYGRVFTNTEYAPYQEFGYTKRVRKGDKIMVYGKWRTATKDYKVVYAGRHFMKNALEKNREWIEKSAVSYIRNYFK